MILITYYVDRNLSLAISEVSLDIWLVWDSSCVLGLKVSDILLTEKVSASPYIYSRQTKVSKTF